MTHLFKNTGGVVLAIFFASSGCFTPEGHSWGPATGMQVKVADSMDLSALGDTFPTNTDSFELMVGGLRTSAGEDRRIKHEFNCIMLGLGDPGEFSGGSHHYFDEGNDLIPFISVFSTVTDSGTSLLTPQLGLRLGGGMEYLVAENVTVHFGADYLLPLMGFKDAYGYEWARYSGLALRIGATAGF